MSHLRSCEGVNSGSGSSSRSIFELYHFDLNLGSTPPPCLVPSVSHLRSCGGSTVDLDPAQDQVVTFYLNLGFTQSLAPVPSMSHLRSCEGVNSGSGSSSRSIFELYHFDLNLGSTPPPCLVPSVSHLRSCGGSTVDLDPTQDQVVTFYLNLGFTQSLAPVPSMSHLSSCGGSSPDPAQDPYLGCNLLTLIWGPLYLWLQFHLCLTLTLSMPHMTIVAISCLVEKVPLQELLSATEFSVRLV